MDWVTWYFIGFLVSFLISFIGYTLLDIRNYAELTISNLICNAFSSLIVSFTSWGFVAAFCVCIICKSGFFDIKIWRK